MIIRYLKLFYFMIILNEKKNASALFFKLYHKKQWKTQKLPIYCII